MYNPGDVINGYKIIKHINTGGFAEAYQAEKRKSTYFLKKYTDPSVLFTPWVKEYIKYQEEVNRKLNSDPLQQFLVSVLDEFVYDDFYIQVHEWSPYTDLSEYLSNRKAIGSEDDLLIAKVFMSTMAYLHSQGIIHTDLKPENIMLIKTSSNNYSPRICDFDWSLIENKKHPWEGGVRGTVFYMSYEHIISKQIKPSSDIYTCGIILYELLTGKNPIKALFASGDYSDKEIRSILQQKLKDHNIIPKPSMLCDKKFNFNSKIDNIIHQCLHPDMNKRPTAKEVHDILLNKNIPVKLYLNHKNGLSLILSKKDVQNKTCYLGRERCRMFENHEFISRLQAWILPSKNFAKWFVKLPSNLPTNVLTVTKPSGNEEKLSSQPIELIPGSVVRIRGSKDYGKILCEWTVEYKPE